MSFKTILLNQKLAFSIYTYPSESELESELKSLKSLFSSTFAFFTGGLFLLTGAAFFLGGGVFFFLGGVAFFLDTPDFVEEVLLDLDLTSSFSLSLVSDFADFAFSESSSLDTILAFLPLVFFPVDGRPRDLPPLDSFGLNSWKK